MPALPSGEVIEAWEGEVGEGVELLPLAIDLCVLSIEISLEVGLGDLPNVKRLEEVCSNTKLLR